MKILTSLGLAAAVAVVSTTAFAADLPNKKKAPVTIVAPRAFSWTGIYAGANGGLITANSHGAGSSTVGNATGGILGLTAGYNAQMPNNVVLGVEGDYGRTNADSTGVGGEAKVNSLSTLRARAGLAMDRFLPYVTAGYAGASVKLSDTAPNTKTLNGWTAGVGGEYAITDKLSAKAEALYVSLNKAALPTSGDQVGYDSGVYRVGLNYHF